MSFKVINGKVFSEASYTSINNSKKSIIDNSSKSFQDILKSTVCNSNSFLISNHAAERLQDRNINLNSLDMNKINEGINKAEGKGCKDCLILYKDVALVTSITNRTIITAVDKESSKGNVFTNIDSVVII